MSHQRIALYKIERLQQTIIIEIIDTMQIKQSLILYFNLHFQHSPSTIAARSKNTYKQGKSKPVKSPKKPPQPKPSRDNVRRRSSMPTTSAEAISSSMGSSTLVEEIENAEKVNLRKASIASYTAEQQRKVDMVKNDFPNQQSSKNKPSIQRQLSLHHHNVTNELLAAVQERENEKNTNDNILLYDEVEDAGEASMVSRNRKTINMIKSLNAQPSDGVSSPEGGNDLEGRSSRSRTRGNRSVADAARIKSQNIVMEGEMGLIFRLRRMVPPGRHCYVFAVGLDFEKEGKEGANTVIDSSQPHNLTTAALKPESVTFARSQGISLPKRVNTIYMFKTDLNVQNNNLHGQKALPTALVLASKLSNAVNPKPRSRFMPTLGNRKKLWNRMESVLFKQWVNHQQKFIQECFHADWSQSSIYTLLMGVSSDKNERHEIMSALKEHYALLKVDNVLVK